MKNMQKGLLILALTLAPALIPTVQAQTIEPRAWDARAVWPDGKLDAQCRQTHDASGAGRCLLASMRRQGASRQARAFAAAQVAAGDPGWMDAYRRDGPVGIASITYPYRANTNEATVLIGSDGKLVDVDAFQPGAQDKARADYRQILVGDPDAMVVAPGVFVGSGGAAPSRDFLFRFRLASCHACASLGMMDVAYEFDATGHFVGQRVASVHRPVNGAAAR